MAVKNVRFCSQLSIYCIGTSSSCPLGTQYDGFEEDYTYTEYGFFSEPIERIRTDQPIDRMHYVVGAAVVFSIAYFALIKLVLLTCSSQSVVTVFFDYDNHYITAGPRKSAFGGIMSVWWYCVTMITFIVYYYWYVYLNQIVEYKYMRNKEWTPVMQANIEVDFEAYVSTFEPALGQTNNRDLCQQGKYSVSPSAYFEKAGYIRHTCEREVLSEFTDKYIIRAVFINVPEQDETIEDEFVTISLHTMPNQVTHSFETKLANVWNYHDETAEPGLENEPRYYSYSQGFNSPGLEYGLKGQEPTVVNFDLVATYYVNHITMEHDHGYRFKHSDTTYGSVVDAYNLTASEEGGFNVQLIINQFEFVYKSSESIARGNSLHFIICRF